MSIVDYKVAVEGGGWGNLEEKVRGLICEGWEPLGGVFYVDDYMGTGGGRWCQAMVRYE